MKLDGSGFIQLMVTAKLTVCALLAEVSVPITTLTFGEAALTNWPASVSAASVSVMPFNFNVPGTYVVFAGIASVNRALFAVPIPLAVMTTW